MARSAIARVSSTRERHGLAEDVDPAHEVAARLEHRPADELDVPVAVLGVLVGHDVRPEERHLLGQLRGDLAQPALAVHGQLVPGLRLDRRRAAATHREKEPRAVLAQLARRGRPRRRATVAAIPPPVYAAPASRASNSAERSPAKTRWVWLSTKPGITARPAASRCRSAAGVLALGPTQATRPASMTRPAPWSRPTRPSPSVGSLVVSSEIPLIASELTGPRSSGRAPPSPRRPPRRARSRRRRGGRPRCPDRW